MTNPITGLVLGLRGGALDFFFGFAQVLDMTGPVPGYKPIDVIAIRAVTAKTLLVEQAFDSASEANLVGVLLDPDGPAHFLVPATS